MSATCGGYPWLPRMINKARAAHANTLGPYFRYPCPIDTECLRLLGVSAEVFMRAAVLASTDGEVLYALRENGAVLARLRGFDPVRLNDALHRVGS